MNRGRRGNMEIDGASANRRPLKSRGTAWAAAAARLALASGISADGVSILGIVISLLGAAALVTGFLSPWHFLIGAAAVQLRLLCNMIDGMVALEGGRKSPYGPIYNELPDRIEDSLLLIAAGMAAGVEGFLLGSLAALLAAICAYVRLLGGTLGQPQDFSGPQAKPHRMFVLTIGLVAAFLGSMTKGKFYYGSNALTLSLAIIAAGTLLTIARRTLRIARRLREAQ
ncbi:MAG TPA: CDP-alcohol phosphatidyltransferase family protein [Sphingomicrobium sp.]|nr:CDP-alcohol phosphatidyltransferase family protein [Sphingomicrobium sp.]